MDYNNSPFHRFFGWQILVLAAVFQIYTMWYTGPGPFGHLADLAPGMPMQAPQIAPFNFDGVHVPGPPPRRPMFPGGYAPITPPMVSGVAVNPGGGTASGSATLACCCCMAHFVTQLVGPTNLPTRLQLHVLRNVTVVQQRLARRRR